MRLANLVTAVLCFLLVVWFITGFQRPATARESGCSAHTGARHPEANTPPETPVAGNLGR